MIKTMSYKLDFLDKARFMARLLQNLFGNLAEVIHKNKCKHELDNKEFETYAI